jgi:hypothetical protein
VSGPGDFPINLALVLTVSERVGADPGQALIERCLHVVVHAWYEGHLDVHLKLGTPVPFVAGLASEPFPHPFPAPDNERLGEIAAEAATRFEAMPEAALAYAAALAWEGGAQEAQVCEGCTIYVPGADIEMAKKMRDGRFSVVFVPDDERPPAQSRAAMGAPGGGRDITEVPAPPPGLPCVITRVIVWVC